MVELNTVTAPCCGPTCCGGEKAAAPATEITKTVREKYGSTAKSSLSSKDAGVHAVAEAFGYSAAELASIPAEANMGLSCGNPTAMANLRPGEVVLDLGSGGGLDVFLAARKVGHTGRAIGVDMTEAMVERARRGAAESGLTNVEFHLGSIDRLPIGNASVDVVISNCVINLAADKPAVFREIARVLRPGGRVAISDIALMQPLPAELAQDIMAFVGCVAGAISIMDYVKGLKAAGLVGVTVTESGSDLNAYAHVDGQSACYSPPMASSSTLPISQGSPACCEAAKPESAIHGPMANLLRQHDINAYAAAVKVYALKPPA